MKVRFLFIRQNVSFVNVIFIKFVTCLIGSDWYLVIFLTVLQRFLCCHGLFYVAYHIYYFHILLLASIFARGHLYVFWMLVVVLVLLVMGCCLFIYVMLHFLLKLNFICCFSDSSWLWLKGEVDLDGDFPLLLFKASTCSTVVCSCF